MSAKERAPRSKMKGVCLNTATKKELLEEADVNVILRMRRDNGQLERATLFGELTLTEEQLQELVSKGVVQVIFLEDLAGLADDGSSVAVTQEKGYDSDLRDIWLALKNVQEKDFGKPLRLGMITRKR